MLALHTHGKPFLIFLFKAFAFTRVFAQGDVLSIAERDSITHLLLRIDEDDQRYRNQMDHVQAQYGGDSEEMKSLFAQMKAMDSINLFYVEFIIKKYGWLGASQIGSQANTTLFMVIQHADLEVQEKYLPLMRHAVKEGNANAHSLALLEDRVALLNGRKQTYGSQLMWNTKTNVYYIAPLDDPDNVDKRRLEVGLGSMAEYIKDCCNLTWDVEQYKKDLPAIEKEFFKR